MKHSLRFPWLVCLKVCPSCYYKKFEPWKGFNFLLTFLNYDEIVFDGKKDGQEFSEQVHVHQEVGVDDEG